MPRTTATGSTTTAPHPSFPFIGAGAARYFEWADLYVRFERAPTAAQKKKLVATAPPPIADAEWDGPLLYLSSDQGVGRSITAAYGGKKPRVAPELTATNRFHASATSAVERFNAHIDAWLASAHALCPILLAFRREDEEAGGTKLSAWHAASVRRLPAVTKAILAAPVAKDAVLLERVAQRDDVKVPARAIAKLKELARDDEDELEDDDDALNRARLAPLLATPKGYKADKLPTMKEKDVEAALARLEKVLPKTVAELRRVPLKERRLRPGAEAASFGAVEKVLKKKLSPSHRALLEAFDGGTVRKLVLLGTEAGGARGADALESYGRAVQWFVPVVRTGTDAFVHTKKAGDGATWVKGSLEEDWFEDKKSSPKLDALLAEVVKAGTC